MRLRNRFLLDALEQRALLSNSIPLSSTQWTALGPAPLGSTYSGRVAGIAAHPTDSNTVYVATAGGGVFKTINGGTSWTALTDSQSSLFMGAIAVAPSNPNVIYAGTGEATNSGLSFYGRGVLKSTDAGATWSLQGNSVFDRRTISSVQIDPTNPNIVYVAVAGGGVNGVGGGTGIFKSIDGGASWNNTTSAISSNSYYSDVQIDPNNGQNLYMAIGDLGGSALCGVYRSTNAGTSWSLAGNFPGGFTIGNTKIAVSKSSPGTVYASVIGTGQSGSSTYGSGFRVFKTTDFGATWNPTTATPPNWTGTQGWYDTCITVDPANANNVFLGGSSGGSALQRSTNGGASWAAFGSGGTSPHADHHALAFDAAGRLLDGDDGGVFRLANPATSTSWVSINNNLNSIQFIGISLHPTNPNIAYGGSQDNGTEKFNDNFNWQQIRGGDGGFTRVDLANPSTVYHEYQYGAVERSDDGGATWVSATNGIDTATSPFYTAYVLDPANTTRLLYGSNRVYETTNRGNSWTAISAVNSGGWTSNGGITALALARTDANTIFAAVGSTIFVTINHGTSWVNRSISGVTGTISDIQIDPFDANIAYAVRGNFGSNGHIWRTSNGGATWTNISSNLPDLPTYSVQINSNNLPGSSDDLLYVGTDSGVYASSTLGASWSKLATGLPNVQVRDLEFAPQLGILAAGTHGRGMWELLIPQPNGIWTGLGDNATWTDVNNWSNHVLPAASDDVLVVVPTNPTVTAATSVSVRSIHSEEALTLSNNFSVAQTSRFGNLSIGGSGVLNLGGNSRIEGNLSMASGARANLTSGGNKVLVARGISLAGTARIDLSDNDMILDYNGASQLDAVDALIRTARNGGAWNGAGGITSSAAAAANPRNTTLGAIESSDFLGLYGTGATFAGQAIDNTAVLVKYTYYGDADFNGRVNFDDYVRTDNGFNNHRTGWVNGDFDGNGDVNFDDYVLIDLAFNTQGGTL